jgi:electron transfer flavoprotein beta subunit
MKTVVLVKQVPDTAGTRTIDPATGRVDRTGDVVIDEIGERAMAVALDAREQLGGEIVALTMGPEKATDALRRCLALGADEAIHLSDERLAGADVLATARALAAALRGTAFDLVIAGVESTDGKGGVVPTLLGELLGVPVLAGLAAVAVADGTVSGERVETTRSVTLEAATPAVVSVTEAVAEPRHPSLKGVMGAKKKPVTVLGLDDLDGLADALAGPRSQVRDVTPRPPRAAGTVIDDDGTAGERIAALITAALG